MPKIPGTVLRIIGCCVFPRATVWNHLHGSMKLRKKELDALKQQWTAKALAMEQEDTNPFAKFALPVDEDDGKQEQVSKEEKDEKEEQDQVAKEEQEQVAKEEQHAVLVAIPVLDVLSDDMAFVATAIGTTTTTTSAMGTVTRGKKQSIPKHVRQLVWHHYIGDHIIQHRCLCCKKSLISNTHFEVGHVVSEAHGGTLELYNLRPVCGACNRAMGTTNMIDFVKRYGLYIG